MAKNTKRTRDEPPLEETRKLYARAYAARLAKQVTEELEGSRRKTTAPKKRDGKQ